jgi:hypothetical protein
MREWRREWRMVRQRDELHTSHSETTRRADEMPRRAAKQETATGGSRASARVVASTGPSGKQNSGAPDRAAGARSDGACRVRGSERLERRQERPAAERAAGSLRAAGDLQALGSVAGLRGRPASEPGRTTCTSTPGSRACACTPACRRRAGQRCCREGTGRGRTVGGVGQRHKRPERHDGSGGSGRGAGRGSAGRSPSSSTRRWTASPARRARSSTGTGRSVARARSEEDERPRKTTSRARGRQAGRRTERCAAHQSSRHPPGKRPQPNRDWARPRQPWRRSAVGEERAGGWRLGGRDAVGWGPAAGREEGGKNLI